MAISSIEFPCDKTRKMSQESLHQYTNDPPDLFQKENLCNITQKTGRQKKKTYYKSPYLSGDSVRLLSRVTEKRFIHKKGSHLSSIPLPNSIYKVNSDDFKAVKNNGKQVLKSVLTLPPDSNVALKLLAVSDVNDSEDDYFLENTKKRSIPAHTRKCRSRGKGFDRDFKRCTDLDTRFDSSHDRLKNFGDSKRPYRTSIASKGSVNEKVKPHEVWAMLKNMNRFQFSPSPQISEDSFISKNGNTKRRNIRKDFRVVETRRTEEFAYVSNYKMDSPCYSLCSSFDKVTVIDKNQNFKMNSGSENKIPKKKKLKKQDPKSINKSLPKPKVRIPKHNNIKALNYGSQHKGETNAKISSHSIQFQCKEKYNTTSDDLGYESKATEHDEDFNISENDIRDEISLYSVVYSDNSGSSKAALLKQAPQRKVSAIEKSVMANMNDHATQINGITKVTVGKVQDAETQHNAYKVETVEKNPHISVAQKNPPNTPRLTRTEINRQLNKYKFPIIVLGKDKLRSATHVVKSEYPQFNGLDEKIWPFMQSWYEPEQPPKPMRKQFDQPNRETRFGTTDRKKQVILRSSSPKQKVKDIANLDKKHTTSPHPQTENMKTHSRMIETIYKNTTLKTPDESHRHEAVKKDKSPVRIHTSTCTELDFNHCGDTISSNEGYNSASTFVSTKNTSTTTKSYVKKHGDSISTNDYYFVASAIAPKCTTTARAYARKCSWAKAKWADDFIDNVLKNIRSGTYYSEAHNSSNYQKTLPLDIKEEGIQTETNSSEECLNSIIPGFNNVVPEIEIKTMNMNEVTVKHCVTNIILNFDVIVLSKPVASVESTYQLIPVSVTKSLTNIFKSPTSISNTMLPAELCSILPKMFRNIVESGQHLAISPPPVERIICLSNVTEESTRCQLSKTNISEIMPKPADWLSDSILPLTPTPLGSLLNGTYNNKAINIYPNFNFPLFSLEHGGRTVIEGLKPKLSRPHLFDCDIKLILPLQITRKKPNNIIPQKISMLSEIPQINTCSALQPYEDNKLLIGSKAMQLAKILESMKTLMNSFGLWIVDMSNNYVNINLKIEKLHKIPGIEALRMNNSSLVRRNNFSSSLNKMTIISTLPNFANKIIEIPRCSTHLQLSLCDKEAPQSKKLNKEPQKNDQPSINVKIPKKKTFGKLKYRKCKSASSIMHGSKTTPLTKINDLDDFFQVLGSSKLLATVFDSQSSLKLMTLLKEMKNWTTDINARQALLLLLLSNKKDTPNLVRYRPVILQGIAVNRITKVHELDMEIEVIETENLNGNSPRYEGILYLPASIENQDTLYEELCWIAKNTASDYQKPFNQTSERLLRSLLEKRKKLNPSYLRVMARYVGLGLLKTQDKKLTF